MDFSRQDTCKFIADQTAELSKLAAAKGLDALTYILSIAETEAQNQITAQVKQSKSV